MSKRDENLKRNIIKNFNLKMLLPVQKTCFHFNSKTVRRRRVLNMFGSVLHSLADTTNEEPTEPFKLKLGS